MTVRRRFTTWSLVWAVLGVASGMLLVPRAAEGDPWPGDLVGTEMPVGEEPSGIVWHDGLEKLFWVDDGGELNQMAPDGTIEHNWDHLGTYDLEGIAIADSSTSYVYVGVENPDSIREFDVSDENWTGKTWDLTTWMTGASNQGLEALTFVPNGAHPYTDSSSGGLFYAGLQEDGRIYVFDVDLSESGTVAHIDTITPAPVHGDLAGLHYHAESATLYAVYDSSNLLREMEADGTYIAEWDLPGASQEGVTLVPSCPSTTTDIYIAQDGGEIMEYGSYPAACADSDGDGLTNAEETDAYETDPYDADTDDDHYSDCVEIVGGSDPGVGASTPHIVRVNFQPQDSARPDDCAPDTGSTYDAERSYGWIE